MEKKVDINVDFSLYINVEGSKEITDLDKQMIANTLRTLLQKDFSKTIANKMTDYYNIGHAVYTADGDYISIKIY